MKDVSKCESKGLTALDVGEQTLRSEAGVVDGTHALGCLIPFCSYPSLPFLSRPRLANPTDTSESKTTLQGKASRQNIRYFFTG